MSSKLYTLESFKKAIDKLDEILKMEKSEVNRDSAIKRFEICFDLAWKTIKDYGKAQGVECFSPRSCFKIAFQLELIDHNDKWLGMIDDCNLTTHLYSEEYANNVYKKLPIYLKLFKVLLSRFSEL